MTLLANVVSGARPSRQPLRLTGFESVSSRGDGPPDAFAAIPHRERHLGAGQHLFHQGDAVRQIFLLRDGWAALVHVLPTGTRQILDFALPSAVLGPLDEAPTAYSVQLLTPCAVWAYYRSDILDAVAGTPRLGLEIACRMSNALTLSYAHLVSVGRCDALTRIVHLLGELSERIAKATAGPASREVTLPLSQTEIADALGLTPVHVNRMIQILRREGLVTTGLRSLTVLDPDRLARRCGAPHPPTERRTDCRSG